MYINKSSKSCQAAKDADVCNLGFRLASKKEILRIGKGLESYTIKDGLNYKIFSHLFIKSSLWYIKKLYQKELILTTESNGNSYVLYYKKTRT